MASAILPLLVFLGALALAVGAETLLSPSGDLKVLCRSRSALRAASFGLPVLR